MPVPILEVPSLEEFADEFDKALICDAFPQQSQQNPMVNPVEEVFQIPFYHPRWRAAQKHALERRMAASLGAEAVRARTKHRLVQSVQDQFDRTLHHFIFGW